MAPIRTAGREDIRPVVEMLTRAFAEDPIAAFFFPDSKRRPELMHRFFELQIRHSYLPRGEVLAYEDLASAALVMGPANSPPSARDRLTALQMFWLLGRRLPAVRPLIRRIGENRPNRPHCYVGTLGTDPSRQGEGLASGLLAFYLERCDAAGLLCCLESSNERNLALYERFGFAVHSEYEVSANGPRVWFMRREPKRA